MKFTRETVLTKLKENDLDFFIEVYNEHTYHESNCRQRYYMSYGDGNELIIVLGFEFPDSDDIYVQISGYYSSWDGNRYVSVDLVEPYTYSETRYRKPYGTE